jgi:hypothetical protein
VRWSFGFFLIFCLGAARRGGPLLVGADELGGCVACRGCSSGLLLGRLGFSEGGAASLGELLLRGVGVAASLLSRVDNGGGRVPDHTAARLERAGAAEGREGKIPVSDTMKEYGWEK